MGKLVGEVGLVPVATWHEMRGFSLQARLPWRQRKGRKKKGLGDSETGNEWEDKRASRGRKGNEMREQISNNSWLASNRLFLTETTTNLAATM